MAQSLEEKVEHYLKAALSDVQQLVTTARAQLTAYLRSDRFEADLRKFAGLYGVAFTDEVLATENRELRVRNMIKVVLRKASHDLKRNFLVGGGLGSFWGRRGTVRLASLLGSTSAAVLFITALMAILERDKRDVQ